MGLFDGLGEHDNQQRRAAMVRRQAQMLDEQIAERDIRRANQAKARQRELQEERDQFQPKPQQLHAAPAPMPQHLPGEMQQQQQQLQQLLQQQLQQPPPQAMQPQFSVSPPAWNAPRPMAFNPLPQAVLKPPPQQPSFLQQLQHQFLYQPLLQLPGLLSQPPQQQLPQLPSLPKRSFWEVPSFDAASSPVRGAHSEVAPSLSPPKRPPRAESVDSWQPPLARREASFSEPPRREPRRRSSAALIDIDAEWRAWEAKMNKVHPVSEMQGRVTVGSDTGSAPREASRAQVPAEKPNQEKSGRPKASSSKLEEASAPQPPAPVWSPPAVPPARRFEDLGAINASRLLDDLYKVKRSWSDERDGLRSQAEALRRQAMKLQSEEIVLPSPRSPVRLGGRLQRLPDAAPSQPATMGYRRQLAEPLPALMLPEFKASLRCLDGGAATLFLADPEEAAGASYVEEAPAESSGMPLKTAAGRLPKGLSVDEPVLSEKSSQMDLRKDANLGVGCEGSVGSQPKASASDKKVEETGTARTEGKSEPPAAKKEDANPPGGEWENTLKSPGQAERDSDISQLFTSLQYSDSDGSRSQVPDSTQRRPSQASLAKVVDLGAELKSDLQPRPEDRLPDPVSPGRTQDFLISALLAEDGTGATPSVPGKPPLPPGTARPTKAPEASVSAGTGMEAVPEGEALKAAG